MIVLAVVVQCTVPIKRVKEEEKISNNSRTKICFDATKNILFAVAVWKE